MKPWYLIAVVIAPLFPPILAVLPLGALHAAAQRLDRAAPLAGGPKVDRSGYEALVAHHRSRQGWV